MADMVNIVRGIGQVTTAFLRLRNREKDRFWLNSSLRPLLSQLFTCKSSERIHLGDVYDRFHVVSEGFVRYCCLSPRPTSGIGESRRTIHTLTEEPVSLAHDPLDQSAVSNITPPHAVETVFPRDVVVQTPPRKLQNLIMEDFASLVSSHAALALSQAALVNSAQAAPSSNYQAPLFSSQASLASSQATLVLWHSHCSHEFSTDYEEPESPTEIEYRLRKQEEKERKKELEEENARWQRDNSDARAPVMVNDDANKKGVPSGTSSGLSKESGNPKNQIKKTKTHICQICKADRPALKDFLAHVVTHGEENNPYICGNCKNAFSTPGSRIRHEKNLVCQQQT